MSMDETRREYERGIRAEMLDSFDEELAMEIDDEQHSGFMMRIHDPLKQWKLPPMDMESRRLREQYTKAKDTLLERTHIPAAPWWIVEVVDKKKARLNCIHHLLSQVPYDDIERESVALPDRAHNPDYLRKPVPKALFVPALY